MAMSVNMFGLRFTIECQPRTKNGRPLQRTTGVAKTSSIHPRSVGECIRSSGRPGMYSRIAIRTSGIVRTTPIRNRRVMSASSTFSTSSVAPAIGSRAMPQIGQLPGPSRTTSGCIGHVHLADGVRFGGTISTAGFGPTNLSGSASKRRRHDGLQK